MQAETGIEEGEAVPVVSNQQQKGRKAARLGCSMLFEIQW